MSQAASAVLPLPASLDAEAQDFLAVCEELRVTVSPTPGLTALTSLSLRSIHYGDKTAGCRCKALRVYKFADTCYTVCSQHGLQDIGDLRREYSTPRSTGGVVKGGRA